MSGRCLSWALALSLIAPLAFGVSSAPPTLDLPEVVVHGIDRVRLDARREGVLPIEPPQVAQVAFAARLPLDAVPAVQPQEPPQVTSPGCAYRNPVTGALARATQGAEALYKTGIERLSRDELDEAAFYLSKLRDDHPASSRSDEAAFWLAEIYRQKGQPDRAASFLTLVKGPLALEAAYRLPLLLEAAGDRKAADAGWDAVARDANSPHRTEALYRVAIRKLRAEDSAGAIAALREILEGKGAVEAPEIRIGTLFAMGLALRISGDPAGAEDALTRFLLERPDHPSAPAAQVALGWALLDQRKAREAALRFQWGAEPGSPPDVVIRALHGRVRALADLGDPSGAAEALIALETASSTGPWVGWARADVGWLSFRQHRYLDALEQYQSALKVWEGKGADVPVFMVAECLYQLGRYAEAGAKYREIGPESSLRPTAIHRAGICAVLDGDAVNGVGLFRSLLDRYPAYPDTDKVWVWMGEALFRLQKWDEANRAYGAVPTNSPAYLQALYGRAWISFETQRWEEAADLLTRLLSASPQDPNRDEALLTLARAHFNRRDIRRALEALDRLESRTAAPAYRSAALFYRGWMLSRSDREPSGRQILESLLRDEPKGPYAAQAHLALGWLSYAHGEYEKALDRFEAVLGLSPGGETEREAKQKRADSLYNLGRHAQALEAYRALGEAPDARYGEALSLYRLGRVGDLSQVAEAFSSRFPDDPRCVDLFFTLAQALSESGKPAEAATVYQRASQLSGADNTRSGQARLEAARNLVLAGNVNGAVASLKPLASRTDSLGLAALRELAQVVERQGTPRDAIQVWDQLAARTAQEERTRALQSGARAARAALDWSGSERRIEEALETCPSGSGICQELLIDLGEVLLLDGRPEDASATLARAAETAAGPERLRALLALANAQEGARRPKEALETYLRIGYLYPISEPRVAQALLRAGRLLAQDDKRERARSLYDKVANEGPAEFANEAKALLGGLTE